MSNKITQSREDLQSHLSDHLNFLETSAISYDRGFTGEAKRMANSIRLLLHDTANSHSLFGQLGLKEGLFYDTSLPISPDNSIAQLGLVAINWGPSGAKPIPLLDDNLGNNLRQTDFESWWNATVFVDNQHHEFTRKDIVLAIADQDGGAHVDPELEERYAQLSRNNSLGWVYSTTDSSKPIMEFERAAIRQITHELLKTTITGYTVNPQKNTFPFTIAGLTISKGEIDTNSLMQLVKKEPQLTIAEKIKEPENIKSKPPRKRHRTNSKI